MAEKKIDVKLTGDASSYKNEMKGATAETAKLAKTAKKTKEEVDFFGGGLHDLEKKLKKSKKEVHGYFKELEEAAKAAEEGRFSFAKLGKGLQESAGTSSLVGKKLSGINPTLLGLGVAAGTAGAAVAAVGVAAWKMVEPLVEAREAQTSLARQLGTSTDFIEKFEGAAKSVRIPVEDARDAMSDFAEKLGKAQIGDTDLEKFQLIGMSMEDLKDKSPEDVLVQVLGNINKLGTAAQRQSAAVELFGDKGKELLKLSELGEGAVRGLIESSPVSKLGESLDSISRSLTEIGAAAQAAGQAIGEYLVPLVDGVLSGTLALTKGLGDAIGTILGGGSISDIQWSKPQPEKEEKRREISMKSVEKINDATKNQEEGLKKVSLLQREILGLSDKNAMTWVKIGEEYKDSSVAVQQLAFNLTKVKESTEAIEGIRSQSVGGRDSDAMSQINDLRKYSDATDAELRLLKLRADQDLKTGLGGVLSPAEMRAARHASIDSDRYLSDDEKMKGRTYADREFIANQKSFLEGLGKTFSPLEDVASRVDQLLFERSEGNITGDQFKSILGEIANQRAQDRDGNRLAELYVRGSTSEYERLARFQSGFDRNNSAVETAKNTSDLVEEIKGLRRDLASRTTEALETL